MVTARVVSILGKRASPYVGKILKNMKAVIDAKASEDETKLVGPTAYMYIRVIICAVSRTDHQMLYDATVYLTRFVPALLLCTRNETAGYWPHQRSVHVRMGSPAAGA